MQQTLNLCEYYLLCTVVGLNLISCNSLLTYPYLHFVRTHLMGRILGAQGLSPTPIDTKGFQSVIRLIETVRMHILVLGQTCLVQVRYYIFL